jgi:hypothetical protein
MKSFGNLILMALICIVIFWIFMALRPAHADYVMLKLQKNSGEIFMTMMDIQEKCPEGTQALFDEANKKKSAGNDQR